MTRCGVHTSWSTTDNGVCNRILCLESHSGECGITIWHKEKYDNLKRLVEERSSLEKEVMADV